jgi:glycosyltransferase involved in cell wall biosynthesis
MNLDRCHLIIATLLPERGETGVQTHFAAIADAAASAGATIEVVEPFQAGLIARKSRAGIARLCGPLSREATVQWVRWSGGRLVRAQLKRALRRAAGRRAVIYAQDPLSAQAALAARAADTRVVAVAHFNVSEAYENVLRGNTREGGRLYRDLTRLEAGVLPQVDRLVFPSEFLQRAVTSRVPAIRLERTAVVRNFAQPPEPPERSAPSGDLLAIGTLEPRKNQGYLFEVLAAALRRGRRYTLSIAGDGASRGEFEALAERLGVASQVRFLGFVPKAARLLASHRALAHAARIENMPLTLIEALAYGRPVLAPRVGGIPEIFEHGREGFFWPLDDADAAARLMIAALDDGEAHRHMSQRAAERYQIAFAPDRLARQWLAEIFGDGAIDALPLPGAALMGAAAVQG